MLNVSLNICPESMNQCNEHYQTHLIITFWVRFCALCRRRADLQYDLRECYQQFKAEHIFSQYDHLSTLNSTKINIFFIYV